jgi:4-carboxymuconolactone decarboxylase
MSAQPDARLSPLTAVEWGDQEYAAYGVMVGVPGSRMPRAGSGHRLDPLKYDVIGLLARHPAMAGPFLTFNSFLLQRGELSLRHRELSILRVAHASAASVIWSEHTSIALQSGITTNEIESLKTASTEFTGTDLQVLSATDEVLDMGAVSPKLLSSLIDAIGTHEVMELIFLVGTYRMLAALFSTAGLGDLRST